jgi:LPXTG-site transpeptidase (sortase) family protein
MSLKVQNTRRIIINTVLIILLLIFSGCVVKVLIWEHNYYATQEGKTRVKPELINANAGDEILEIDDTEPTVDDISSYTVAPDMPRYLSVPQVNIEKTRVRSVGLTKDNKVDVPKNNYDVAWYNKSAKPGTGGTVLIDGHSGARGIFNVLDQTNIGDLVYIEMGNGTIYKYKIVEKQDLKLADANNYMGTMLQSPQPGVESLSLITCAGYWSQNMQSYTARTMIRALKVD